MTGLQTDARSTPDALAAARALLRENQPAEAVATLKAHLQVQPDDAASRLLLARALTLLGDEFGAEGEYAKVVASGRALEEAYERWGKLCLGRDARDEARAVFARWAGQCPESPAARHWLAASGGAPPPNRMHPEVVTSLYDGFAPDFDLVMERVGYLGPMLIGAILEREIGAPQASLDILDVGCGTGLCAHELRPYARSLTGIDLSRSMLDQAAHTGHYDRLERHDMAALSSQWYAGFDIVCCAEALIYFGDLRPPIAALSRLLRPNGALMLTTEQLDAGDTEAAAQGQPTIAPYTLNISGRFAHADGHLEAAMTDAGLERIRINGAMLRTEGGEPVHGWLGFGWRAKQAT